MAKEAFDDRTFEFSVEYVCEHFPDLSEKMTEKLALGVCAAVTRAIQEYLNSVGVVRNGKGGVQ